MNFAFIFQRRGDTPAQASYPEDIRHWKEKIVSATYWAGLVFAALAFLPSLYFLILDREWVVIMIDSSAMIWVILVILRPRWFPYAVRAGALLMFMFAIGASVLLNLGPFSASLVWLFGFTVMSSLIGGAKGGVISLLVNLALFGTIGGLIGSHQFSWATHVPDPSYRWIVISANFLLLDALVITAINMLIRGLQFNNQSALTALERLEREQNGLQQALREKSALLQEVHHRVKNNLQVVTSLINLQAGQESDPRVVGVLDEARRRVSAMALVHESLYRSGNLAEIDLAQYVRALCDSLMEIHDNTQSKYSIEADLQPSLAVGLDHATPCGLVINELVTNSVKHAFPDGKPGRIVIAASRTDPRTIQVVVKDNGIGLPENMDWRREGRLGLFLIVNLVEAQLKGKVEYIRGGGAEFRITFPAGSATTPDGSRSLTDTARPIV